MLNKNNERELCYVVSIDNILPIEDADRVEIAVVGGWRVMVRKNQFKPGDLAVYFEIDSKVPAREPFMFLESKGFKIKTQKYFKGTVLSQGLLMSFEDFGWEPDFHKKGDFLTKELGVIYSVEEDNKRKANSVNKYEDMARRHKKLFSKPPFKTIMKYPVGRDFLFIFFGNKKQKKDWPAWVQKTDEERCLSGSTKILTKDGALRIADIVNKRINTEVLSYNMDKKMFEYKPIVDWQRYPANKNEQKYEIEFPYKPGTARVKHIRCTADHRFYTPRGYVRAEELTLNDELYMPDDCYAEDVLPVIYGMLLGDGSISQDRRVNGKIRFQTCHGEKQKEYLEYIQDMFSTGKMIFSGKSGYKNENSIYKFYLDADSYIDHNIKNDWLNKDKKKTISPEAIAKMTEASLAFWYMDDGCLSYREGLNNSGYSPKIRLYTCGFSYSENELLVDMLQNKFGISCHLAKHNEYPMIYIGTNDTFKFLKLITPYMCKSMAYKTLPELEYLLETKKFSFRKTKTMIKVPILKISGYKDNHSTYDLEVKDNHNFIAQGVLTHNCQNMPWILENKESWVASEKVDGTSTTFTMKRGKKFLWFAPKYEFYVCSRNVVFSETKKECYYPINVYFEMAEKYHVQAVLEKLLKENPSWDWVTLQGETYGEGIQKRDYTLKGHNFAGFNFITSADGRWDSMRAKSVMEPNGIPWVPIVDDNYVLPDTIEELLAFATGDSLIDGKMREGLVFRSKDGTKSFKAVSNEFLMKYHR